MGEDSAQDRTDPPQALDYRRRADSPSTGGRTPIPVQVILGAGAFLVSGFLAVASLAPVLSIEPARRTLYDYLLPTGFISVIYSSLGWFGFYSWIRWRWRGFVAGFWGTAGLLLLGISCICGR